MKKSKKVTYTLCKNIIDFIKKQSLVENIPQSKFVSFCIQRAYPLLIEKCEINYKSISTIRKKFGTTQKTLSLPLDIENTLSWFAKRLEIKKSHLVTVVILDFKRELENENLSKNDILA